MSFIQELFAETEKEGLDGLNPHFENVLGENIELKFENNFCRETQEKEFTIKMNENLTLWKLKKQLA